MYTNLRDVVTSAPIGTFSALTLDLVDKLGELSVETGRQLLLCSPDQLCAQSDTLAQQTLEDARREYERYIIRPAVDATTLLHVVRRHPKLVLSTGVESLDFVMSGGVRTGNHTELVGTSGTGKTSICMKTCIFVAAKSTGTAIFIDSSNSFTSKRVEDLLVEVYNGQEVDYRSLGRIRHVAVFDVFELLDALTCISEALEAKEKGFFQDVRLVVIDSLALLLSPSLGISAVGHCLLTEVGRLIRSMCCRHNIALLIDYKYSGGRTKS